MWVPQFRSESTNVRAIDRDGTANNRSTELISVAQTNSGMFQYFTPGARCLRIVTRKFTAPSAEEAERMWRPRIHRLIPFAFGANDSVDSGTYPVHPAYALERIRSTPAGGSIQNAMALIRGRAISRAPIIDGTR